MQRFGISESPGQVVERIDVVLDVRVFGVDPLGELGIVPQIGPLHLRFEFDQSVAPGLDVQVFASLVEASALFAQVVGEVTHGTVAVRLRRGIA